ncbi:MAG: PilZ domain-containing protein, partial [Candidatus Micrarchaeia archaeon]
AHPRSTKLMSKVRIIVEDIMKEFDADLLNISKGGVKIGLPLINYDPRLKYTPIKIYMYGSEIGGRIIWTKIYPSKIVAGIKFNNLNLWARIKVEKAMRESR